MHTVLRVALEVGPFVLVVAAAAALGYMVGVRRCARRISSTLRNDREVGLHILDELAERWGVKVERTETPGGP